MDSRKITGFINKASRRLKLQHLAGAFQIALSLGLAAALGIIVISRLSVFPYYGFYAYVAGFSIMVLFMLAAIVRLPRRHQAITRLDEFTPHNQLLTLSQIPAGNGLTDQLSAKVEKDIHLSYGLFKNYTRKWLQGKWLLISLGLAVLLVISGLFPAAAQLSAMEKEREMEIVEEMIETIENLIEQSESQVVKKELQDLQEELEDSESPEQALRELVKKQKELAMQQLQKESEDAEQAEEEAEELKKAAGKLAEQAGNTQTALSEMGKPVAFDLQQSIAANDEPSESEGQNGSQAAEGESDEQSRGNSEGGQEGESNEGNSSGSSGEGAEETGGEGAGEASEGGQAAEGGSSSSSAEGSAPGQGQGQGEGSGQAGGTGTGTGQGSRNLLSVPSRIGGSAETTIDSGELAEGETGSIERGVVDAERGTVRPYSEVVGSYSDSYFSSAERMRLPPDLQHIVEQYFSAIDGD